MFVFWWVDMHKWIRVHDIKRVCVYVQCMCRSIRTGRSRGPSACCVCLPLYPHVEVPAPAPHGGPWAWPGWTGPSADSSANPPAPAEDRQQHTTTPNSAIWLNSWTDDTFLIHYQNTAYKLVLNCDWESSPGEKGTCVYIRYAYLHVKHKMLSIRMVFPNEHNGNT